jgi:PPM family protein phosphatase
LADVATLKASKPQIQAGVTADAGSSLRTFAMLSHRGRVRRINEDACAALPEAGVFVVCDGMGGAAAGEVASRLAAEAFLDSLRQSSAGGGAEEGGCGRLAEAIRAANDAVFRHSRKSPKLHGMGTTLAGVLWDDAPDAPAGSLWLVHVGDSRCYLLRGGVLQLLTEDHSLVEEQVRAGLITRMQAVASPVRNIITRAIGSQREVEPEIAAHAVEPGDVYLLASDGLTRELEDAKIEQVLLRTLAQSGGAALEAACQALIDAANANGGHDNITVLLVACN